MSFQRKMMKTRPSDSSRESDVPKKHGGAMGAILELQRSIGNQGAQRIISQSIQRKAAPGAVIQRMGPSEEEELQMKADPNAIVQRLAVPHHSTNGNGMPDAIQQKMEAAMNSDFSGVRIHEGSHASAVGALAYTQGTDIHFAPGRYQPNTQSGQELLGHELAHVVQQRQGRVKPTGSVNGLPLNDNSALEREADQLGSQAARSSASANQQ